MLQQQGAQDSTFNYVQSPKFEVGDIDHINLLRLDTATGRATAVNRPAIGGLPYVISGLVAAGGLAAALSTADGLLLAISNALSHDIYYKMVDPAASTQMRVTISKLLPEVAFIAAYAASKKPADILSLVGAAFSLAGFTWACTTCCTNPILGGSAAAQWSHIAPISAGVFGVPAGMAVLAAVSLMTRAPDAHTASLVDHIRAPE